MTCSEVFSSAGDRHDETDSLRHSTYVPECRKVSVISCLSPAEENTSLQANALVVVSRTLLGGGGKSARAGGKPTEDVAVMGGLSPVPLGQRQGRWRDRWRRTVPSSCESAGDAFRFRPLLKLLEMEAARDANKSFAPFD